MTFTIEPVINAAINLKGWRIVRSDGAVLLPFTTRRQAEQLVEFFAGNSCPCDQCNVLNNLDREGGD